MEPAEIIQQAQAEGLRLSLAESGGIAYEGPELAARRWLPAIREAKAALVELLARQVVGLPCGRCGGIAYTLAPGGFTWPDGEHGDGWRCVRCGAVFLMTGAGMERPDQGGEKLSDLFRQLPAGLFVKMKR